MINNFSQIWRDRWKRSNGRGEGSKIRRENLELPLPILRYLSWKKGIRLRHINSHYHHHQCWRFVDQKYLLWSSSRSQSSSSYLTIGIINYAGLSTRSIIITIIAIINIIIIHCADLSIRSISHDHYHQKYHHNNHHHHNNCAGLSIRSMSPL